MEIGDVYEKNGYTVVIDLISKGQVYVKKYKAKIGERGTWDNFCGWFRKSIKAFKKDIESCKIDN